MKIAFMHYHLKTGGVTTVLRKQLEAVSQQCATVVLTGIMPQAPFPADVVHIPELAYSSDYRRSFEPENVAGTILEAIHSRFEGPCDVLHVHNPILAKNKLFLKILKSLQKKDTRLFLQIHDFAEDGRPSAYFAEEYPADCHYGVINSRDYEILISAGLNKKGLHRLENPVEQYDLQPSDEKSFVLYPIRAIRRKNIGEAVLLSSFFDPDHILAVTLPPNSPADIKSYEGWKAFVKEQKLNVAFDKGIGNDFGTMVRSAAFLITTSITEGFGFSFLEPWAFGKLLWGRKLPVICRDFETNGIDLEHMYTGLFVPLEWIDFRRFKKKWTACVLNAAALLEIEFDHAVIRSAFDAITENGTIDFGLLDESPQKQIIRQLVSTHKNREKLIGLNPFLSNPGKVPDKNALIQDNRAAVHRRYSQNRYRQNLREVYQKVIGTPVEHRIDKGVLSSAFLNLEEFSLLKWSDYGG
jgi:hypothetical protein